MGDLENSAGNALDATDLATVAERLRMVRQARRKFLRLWAIDRSLVDPLVDRLAADLGTLPDGEPAPGKGTPGPDGGQSGGPGRASAPRPADES